MKNIILLVLKNIILLVLFSANFTFAQQPYYDDVNLSLTGSNLRNELASKITTTHTNNLSYDNAREALKIVDLKPNQSSSVYLLYGFINYTCSTNSSNDNDHKLRAVSDFGGGASCEWNREHTYPKSLGDPNLGTSGPGADAHHLRAADVQRNGQRGSKRFTSGSGNSGTVGSNWYPGDEWKGDVARMMMYMYLRYGSRCLPTNVCVGSTTSSDSNMVNLLLQWNADDPVSEYEDSRNDYLEDTSNNYGQGNRNPFIDNPYLATLIWGGVNAEDRWNIAGNEERNLNTSISIYPNPTKNSISIKSKTTITKVEIYNNLGQLVLTSKAFENIDISFLDNSLYVFKITTVNGYVILKKIVKF